MNCVLRHFITLTVSAERLTKPKACIKNNYVKIPQDRASHSTVSISLVFSKAVCWALQ